MFNDLVLNFIPSGLFLNTPLIFIPTILDMRFSQQGQYIFDLLVMTLLSIVGYQFLRIINCFSLQHSMEATVPALSL